MNFSDCSTEKSNRIFSEKLHACAHLILYEKINRKIQKNTVHFYYPAPPVHVQYYRGGRVIEMHVAVAALFRKTDWESGTSRGVLLHVVPCWKAERAPRATTKPLFLAEACTAVQRTSTYSRSA